MFGIFVCLDLVFLISLLCVFLVVFNFDQSLLSLYILIFRKHFRVLNAVDIVYIPSTKNWDPIQEGR